MPLQPFSDQSAFAVTEAPGSAFADSERHLIPKEHKQKATTIQEVKNMKTYDVLFAISAIAGLYFIGLDRYGIECLISGLVIGGYIGWRVSK